MFKGEKSWLTLFNYKELLPFCSICLVIVIKDEKFLEIQYSYYNKLLVIVRY